MFPIDELNILRTNFTVITITIAHIRIRNFLKSVDFSWRGAAIKCTKLIKVIGTNDTDK